MKSVIFTLGAAALLVSGSVMADLELAKKSGCLACHSIDKKIVGPSWADVGKKYKGEESTLWLKVVAFGKLAEIIGQYGVKGKQVIVSGPLQIQEWEDNDGNKRYSTEVIANFFQMVGDRGPQEETIDPPHVDEVDDDSDIPF